MFLLTCGIGHWLDTSFCPFSPLGFCLNCFFFCYAQGSIGCHFCYVGLLDFLSLFLGFYGSFTLLLPLVVPVGLLAIIPIIVAHWAFYLFSWVFIVHLLSSCFFHFLFHLSSLLSFSAVGPFVKNGYQHFPNPIIWIA